MARDSQYEYGIANPGPVAHRTPHRGPPHCERFSTVSGLPGHCRSGTSHSDYQQVRASTRTRPHVALPPYVLHAHMRVLTPACHTRFTRTDLASHERLASRASAQVPAWVRGWVGEPRCRRMRIGNGRDGSGYECEAEAIDG